MKRDNAREIATPLGTFYGGIFETNVQTNGVCGPSFYAETESGEITINGVTYSGTVYAERFNHDGSLYLSVRHLTRWDGRHFQPASAAAGRKLSEYLLPTFEAWSADTDYVTSRRIQSLRSSRGYAISDANRDIDKANALAAEIRELGAECADIPRIEAS